MDLIISLLFSDIFEIYLILREAAFLIILLLFLENVELYLIITKKLVLLRFDTT